MNTRLYSALVILLACSVTGILSYAAIQLQAPPYEDFQYDDRIVVNKGFHVGVHGRIVSDCDDPHRMLVDLNERGDLVLIRKDSMHIITWNRPRHKK